MNNGKGLLKQIEDDFKRNWVPPGGVTIHGTGGGFQAKGSSWFSSLWEPDPEPDYIKIPSRKELIHGDFGKDKAPQFPVNGSIIGHCLNFKNEEWLNGMTYGEFMKVILRVDLTPKPEDFSRLIEILNNLNDAECYNN
jgi:hypothetical protein